MKRPLSAVMLFAITAPVLAKDLAFVACPIVRDTRTVPCWLTEYDGELYYLGIQTDVSAPFNPPSLGHRILVEGKSQPESPRICGGIVIESPTVSIINERADDCRAQWPSDDRYQLPFEPPRPPGPSKGRLAFDYAPPEPPPPKASREARTFTVPYDFDGTVGFKTPRFLTPILEFARGTEARRIEIIGYRNVVALSDGTSLAESDALAKRRAEQIAQLLRGAGLTEATYDVKWQDAAEPGGAEKRRVVVIVKPR
ncbi:MAG: hypothetical protein ABW136_03505 [Steroidobacteraceae bacterium]